MIVCGNFDHLDLRSVRLMEEASHHGPVSLHLMRESAIPVTEREYLWSACRYVDHVQVVDALEPSISVEDEELNRVPEYDRGLDSAGPERPKVIVTGCFDWLHSGHLRFFQEASELGELTVVVGSDRNVRLLKGEPHPMFHEQIRRYLVASVRSVARCWISTGSGWMDAAPEIETLRPDIYVVNEDGDKDDKREFCAAHDIRYVVLARRPAHGITARNSSELRGF